MRTYLFVALIAFAIQGVVPCAMADSPQPRQLLARSMTDERPALSNTDRQWLSHRQVLRLGTSAPDYPPLDINISESDYEGLTADYAGLLGDMLDVRIEVLRYASRAEAIDALRAGRIDLLGSSNTFEIADADLVLSQPYADDQSVIVTPVGKTRDASDLLDGLDLAMVDHYLPRADVQALYPKARLRLYPSIQDAIAAVAFGRADAYLGDAISSDYLISKNFQGSVQLSHFIKQEHKAYSFALKRDNPTLQRVIDSALQGIGDSDRLSILRRWSGGSTSMLLSRTALKFSADEQHWMNSHPVVRVVINDSYAPLTFYGDDHRFRGITADVLEQISLRTGLKFEVSVGGSVQEMIEQVLQGKADMIGALSRSNARQHDLGFTRPYLANSYVLVGSTRSDSPDSIEQLQGKRLAVIRGTPLAHYLAQHHRQVQQIEAEDALDAMEMVVRNRADAALNTQISANYFVSRLFKDRLRIVSTVGNTPATSAFAAAANSTQLLSILDKTLLSIPPDEMTQLANRWRTNAVISDSLWRNYRTLILQIVIGAGLLLLAFVIWNGYLRKLIKQRAQAEQALENQLEFMRVLIDGTPHPLYVRDRQGLLLICNNSYLQAFGVSRESVLGKQVTAQVLSDPQEAAAYRADYLRVMEQGTPLLRDSQFHIGAQGRAHTLYHWLLPYRDTRGTVQGVIGGWIDISERKRLLEELHVAKDRADDASRAKTTFLATMSHEIRTPMNAVIGMLEIALKKADQGQLDRFALQVAFDSAKGLLELIGDILDIGRFPTYYSCQY